MQEKEYVISKEELATFLEQLEPGFKEASLAFLKEVQHPQTPTMYGSILTVPLLVDMMLNRSTAIRSLWQYLGLSIEEYSHIDLRGTQFKGKFLIGADLNKTNLSNTDFSDTNLQRVNLSYADLSYADFSGAKLNSAICIKPKICETNFIGASFHTENLDVSNNNLTGTAFIGVTGIARVDLTAFREKGAITTPEELVQDTQEGKISPATGYRYAISLARLAETEIDPGLKTRYENAANGTLAAVYNLASIQKDTSLIATIHNIPFGKQPPESQQDILNATKGVIKKFGLLFGRKYNENYSLAGILPDEVRNQIVVKALADAQGRNLAHIDFGVALKAIDILNNDEKNKFTSMVRNTVGQGAYLDM